MRDYIEYRGIRLSTGSVVKLSAYPDTRWILNSGWYSIEGHYYLGWYFSSIPDDTILSVTPDLLDGIVVISGEPYYPDISPVSVMQCTYGVTNVSQIYYSMGATVFSVLHDNRRYWATCRSEDIQAIQFTCSTADGIYMIELDETGWHDPILTIPQNTDNN